MVSLLNTDEDHYCSDNDYKKDNHSIEKTKKKKYKSYTIEKKNLIIRLSYKYSIRFISRKTGIERKCIYIWGKNYPKLKLVPNKRKGRRLKKTILFRKKI